MLGAYDKEVGQAHMVVLRVDGFEAATNARPHGPAAAW